MATYVEYVTYTVENVDDNFLNLRRDAVLAVKDRHPNLVSVPVFTHDGNGACTEIWIYASKQDADRTNEDCPTIPEFAKYAEYLRNLKIVAEDMPKESEIAL